MKNGIRLSFQDHEIAADPSSFRPSHCHPGRL